MSRTPYSPLVEKARAPLPWKAGRVQGEERGIPSHFVGIFVHGATERHLYRSGPLLFSDFGRSAESVRLDAHSDFESDFRIPLADGSDFARRPISELAGGDRARAPGAASSSVSGSSHGSG